MSARKSFLSHQVVETAFVLLQNQGSAALTSRAIAGSLGASTMPIYSAVGSMEELVEVLRRKSLVLLEGFQHRAYTSNPYLNQAIGYVAFARHERNLFRFLFVDAPAPVETPDPTLPRGAQPPEARTLWFGRIDDRALDAVALKSYFFVHGLAMALALGTAGPYEDDKIVQLLQEAGGAFVQFENNHTGGVK